jgi:hypothetical protein
MDSTSGIDLQQLSRLIAEAKRLAIQYRNLTGRPLGITGEVAEYEAARLLGLRLADVRQKGFDAIAADGRKLQIKGRCVLETSKRGQRLGGIKLDCEWDAVLLVLLDGDFEPIAIYEANRQVVTDAILAPGSKSRNERGTLSISKFKSIGRIIWER